MDMTAARNNLSELLADNRFKDKLFNTLDKLHNSSQLADYGYEASQNKAKNEGVKSFFKKAGGFLAGTGFTVGAGVVLKATAATALAATMAPAAIVTGAAVGGALAIGAAISFHKAIPLSPNSAKELAKNGAALSKEESERAKTVFSQLNEMTLDMLKAKANNSPDYTEKFVAVLRKIKSVEMGSDYIEAVNQRSINQIRNGGTSFKDRLIHLKDKLTNREPDTSLENKNHNRFKLK